MIEDNLSAIRQNIATAARKSGRGPQDIKLICVTKEATPDEVKEAIRCGIADIGSNRLQDAVEKYKVLATSAGVIARGPATDLSIEAKGESTLAKGEGGEATKQSPSREIASPLPFATLRVGARNDVGLKWHFIGHLQTNKVKKAVEIFDLIHSVDSIRLCEAISKEAAKINKTQEILIQVNTPDEKSKFGIGQDDMFNLVKQTASLSNIKVLGLMTIAPLVDNPEKVRYCFRRLRELLNEINASMTMTQLSMGMSNDYQVAIEEGSTMVRIGRAIFKGER